jgi:NAD(P)-dependent dehydrogenase (short-subunit alcohol dehydrogenase family)
MQSFDEKVAIVTGAAGNLGRAVCQAFAGAGARVAMVDLSHNALEEARSELSDASDVAVFAADLIKPQSVADMVERVDAHFDRIDILANVAGGFTMGPPFHETEDKDWDFMMDLNARTVFNTCRAVVPHMLNGGGGKIVSVSARAAAQGKGHMAP